jgi:hypothetical protein
VPIRESAELHERRMRAEAGLLDDRLFPGDRDSLKRDRIFAVGMDGAAA